VANKRKDIIAKEINKRVRRFLGSEFKVDIIFVSHIEREPNGKLKFVKNLID
jgi:hypothetical protein